MRIGEVAKCAGCSSDTIRYYEKQGLLKASVSRLDNGYRDYSEEVLERLAFIDRAKGLGFTLREIKWVLEVWEGTLLSREEKAEAIRDKLTSLEAQLVKLQDLKHYLLDKLMRVESGEFDPPGENSWRP
jgi:MerR family transcriptional regulator, copper efflux regulator